MTDRERVEFRTLCAHLLQIAKEYNDGTRSSGELLAMQTRVEVWVDKHVDQKISIAVAPFVEVQITEPFGKNRRRDN